MQISFHGAVQTVTGSQHLIRVDGKSVLLDCGLYQGKRDEARSRNRNFLFDAGVEPWCFSRPHRSFG
jgi:metallo-beta-lactamase family protein